MATSNARFEKVFESSEAMRLKVVESEQLERKRAKTEGSAASPGRTETREHHGASPRPPLMKEPCCLIGKSEERRAKVQNVGFFLCQKWVKVLRQKSKSFAVACPRIMIYRFLRRRTT